MKHAKKFIKRFFNIKDGRITKVFALYDSHYPYNIDINPLLDFLKDYRPDEIIFGGDNWDISYVSHWNEEDIKNEGFHYIRKRLHQEAAQLKEQIERFRKTASTRRFTYILGNHEDWLNQFESKHPSISHKEGLSFKRLLGLTDANIIPQGGIYRLGKLNFMHGDQFGSENAPKQSLMRTKGTTSLATSIPSKPGAGSPWRTTLIRTLQYRFLAIARWLRRILKDARMIGRMVSSLQLLRIQLATSLHTLRLSARKATFTINLARNTHDN